MADGCACCGGASAARLLILYCRPEHARVNRMSSPRPALACSGPSGFQPKGNLSFTFTSLDSSGQAAQAASGHECWLESVAAVSTASYSPCTTPITLPADIQVRGCFHGWASMCAAGRSFLRFATTALISLPMRVLPCLPLLLQDGQYRFHARAVGSGATPGAEAVSVFTVDSVAPVVTIKGACVYLSGAGQGWAGLGVSLPQLPMVDRESQPPASCPAPPLLPLAPPLLQRSPRRYTISTRLLWALPPARRAPTSFAGEQAGRQLVEGA